MTRSERVLTRITVAVLVAVTVAAPAGGAPAPAVKLTLITTLSAPIAMSGRSGDLDFYVAEKGGRVQIVDDGLVTGTALDISSEVSTGNEQGLLGLAFNAVGDKLYVSFTNTSGDSVIREYAFALGTATSPRDVLTLDQPFDNHNGGNITFGPDGYLYIGFGDGGGGGDPLDSGQNIDTLLGKLLRIDPNPSGTDPYGIPADNPFVGEPGRDEIWAFGLRNPWRFSFDAATGDLYTADVGQNTWEEVNVVAASSDGGENYGWNPTEGRARFNGAKRPKDWTKPVYAYSHESGACSVTGGYVYRGAAIPALQGTYVFADFCTGDFESFIWKGGSRRQNLRTLPVNLEHVSSFGEDNAGELYVMSLDGGLYRIDADP